MSACSSSDQRTYCSPNASSELKLYQAFIFSVPVVFTIILLLLFCVFYLRRQRSSLESMRMRASQLGGEEIQRPLGCGIKKEVRELLPVVVFKESFLIRETQCSVCLGDYQSDERLQRIPSCGHTFHVECIDHWLATNTTCPLCRVSLLPSTKSHANSQDYEEQGHQSELQLQEQLEESERVCDGVINQSSTVREFKELGRGEGSSAVINIDGGEH